MKKLEWYLVDEKRNEPKGPFDTQTIIKLIQSEELEWDDYIWGRHLPTQKWVRVFSCPEFEEIMKAYPTCRPPQKFEAGEKEQTTFEWDPSDESYFGAEQVYRRYPRAPLETQVIVHNHKKVIWGQTEDVSERGCYLALKGRESFRLGEEVIATIRNFPLGLGTVSTPAIVIRNSDEHGAKGLGLFFYKLSPKFRRGLAYYVIKALKEEDNQSDANEAA